MNIRTACLSVMILLVCVSCGSKSVTADKTSNQLLPRLGRCGVDISKATLIEAPKAERHVALKGHPDMTRQSLDCVAKVMVEAAYGLRTDNVVIEYYYPDAWRRARRRHDAVTASRWLATHRPALALKKFEHEARLEEYINSVVYACGARPGSARLEIHFVTRDVVFPDENRGDQNTDCVENALTAGLVDEDVSIFRWAGVP